MVDVKTGHYLSMSTSFLTPTKFVNEYIPMSFDAI